MEPAAIRKRASGVFRVVACAVSLLTLMDDGGEVDAACQRSPHRAVMMVK